MRSSAARWSSDHTLIAFGGAAPLHAARVAEKLGVARVLVPPNAGVGSAVGFLAAPISYELIKSRHMRLDNFDFAGASALLAEMAQDARALVEPGARGAPVTERRIAYMRYVGQGHEITVPLPVRDLTADDAVDAARHFRDGIFRAVPPADPGRRDRGAELVGADFDRGAAPDRACAGGREARAGAGRQPRRSSTAARAPASTCRSIGASAWRRARA